jgi:hypothetical protein
MAFPAISVRSPPRRRPRSRRDGCGRSSRSRGSGGLPRQLLDGVAQGGVLGLEGAEQPAEGRCTKQIQLSAGKRKMSEARTRIFIISSHGIRNI